MLKKLICVKFIRETSLDSQKEDIQYSGFRFTWPDGEIIQTGLNKFCQRGMRLFFGKEGLQTNEATLKLYCNQVSENDPLTKAPENVKVRRFILQRDGNLGTIFFVNGVVTDVAFDMEKEEKEVLQWIGLDTLKDKEKIFLDIYALPTLQHDDASENLQTHCS